MSLFFIMPWCALLYFSSKAKSRFLFFFVLCQFVFVGFGLSLFPFLGMDYLSEVFSSFDLSSIDKNDFNFASFLLFVSVFVVVVCSIILAEFPIKKRITSFGHLFRRSHVRPFVVLIFAILSCFLAVPFLVDNYKAFVCLTTASSYGDLGGFVDFRRDATSNYLITLFIYNLLPATATLSFLLHLEKHKRWTLSVFLSLFALASMSLLMTFQKRPLLVFWGSSGLAYLLYMHKIRSGRFVGLNLFDLIKKQWPLFLALLTMLFVFYYFYTGYRFESDFFSTFSKIGKVVFTRLIGRLSVPAAMYVDFFPDYNEYYGLSNIRMFNRLFSTELFLDTKFVYSNYASKDGSIAASIFFDAYGQGGIFVVLIYSFLISIIIFFMDYLACRNSHGVQDVFFVVSGFIFVYYLSQASLFRAAFGYGWFFYLIVWFVGIGSQKKLYSKIES